MLYSNITPTHEFEKKQALRKFFYSNYGWDCIIILGAQDRSDVHDLVDIANDNKIKCILFDIRTNQLNAFPNNPNTCKLNWDISKTNNIKDILNICKLFQIQKPFIYDNTCGGPTRMNHIQTALSLYNDVIFFAHTGRGGKAKAEETFKIIQHEQLSPHNFLLHVTKKEGDITTPTPTTTIIIKTKSHVHNPNRIKCPHCKATSAWVTARKTKLPEFHCSKCKQEWN